MNPKSLAIWGSLSLALHAGLLAVPGSREATPPSREQRLEVGLVAAVRSAELSRAAAKPHRPRPAPAPEGAAPSPAAPSPAVPATAAATRPEEKSAQALQEPARQHPARPSRTAPSAPTPAPRKEHTPPEPAPSKSTATGNAAPATAPPAQPEPAPGTAAGNRAPGPDASASRQPAAAGYRAATPDYASNPPPPYPAVALRRRWTGEVWLRVRVTAAGDVARVRVARSSGYRVLDDAALRAVRDWIFQPARRAGCNIPCEVRVPVRFRLAGR